MKKSNPLKGSYNNILPFNRGNTDEKPLSSDRNASQNMRAYSFNKYSNNDLKIINRKNTNNFNMKSMNINMVNIKKNKFDEDFKSDIEDILEGSVINFPLIQTKDKLEKIKGKLNISIYKEINHE